MRVRFLLGLAFTSCVMAAQAQASFHLMKIKEIFAGAPASPNAQYVELQMYAAGQNFVGGHGITVFNASGQSAGSFLFSAGVSNGANQATILIATPDAQSFFSVAADLTMTVVLSPLGGAVCFDAIPVDCVSWGSFARNDLLPTSAGTPFGVGSGLPLDQAIRRRLDIAGSPTTLDAGDDTNDSANDFRAVAPAPQNNAGVVGAPASTPTPTSTATATVAAASPTASPSATFLPSPTPSPSRTPATVVCTGDCNNDGSVRVDELVKGVTIALGSAPVSECRNFDRNGDGKVTVDELVVGVNNALTGCPLAQAASIAKAT